MRLVNVDVVDQVLHDEEGENIDGTAAHDESCTRAQAGLQDMDDHVCGAQLLSSIILPWTVPPSSGVSVHLVHEGPPTTTTRGCNSSSLLPGLASSGLQCASFASVAHELPLFAPGKAVPAPFAREGQGHPPPSAFIE